MLDKSYITNGSLLMYTCQDYHFVLKADLGLAYMSSMNKTMYLTLFHAQFIPHVFNKIQSEIKSHNLQLDSRERSIPNVIRKMACLVIYFNGSVEYQPIILGTKSCRLKNISVPYIWPGSTKIGEGGFGCIHAPSLMCKEKFDSAFYKGKISKIQTKKHTRAEMLQNKIIDGIDPDNKYHINAVACTAKQDADFDHSVGKCHSMRRDNNTDYGLIIMDNGGINMYNIFENTQKEWSTVAICNLYVDALSLFEAVQLFVQKGFVHYDIKFDNIVYNASKREMKFIDFGMSDTINRIYNNIYNGKYNYSFVYNKPPEFFLFNSGPKYDKVIDGAKFTEVVNTIANFNIISNLKSKSDFIAKSEIDFKKVIDSTEVLDVADILSKTDSYALGVAMQFINNRITDNILLRSLPLTGFEIFIAHLDVLISKLMCMNFQERLHIDSAVSQYVQLLTLLPSIGRIKIK